MWPEQGHIIIVIGPSYILWGFSVRPNDFLDVCLRGQGAAYEWGHQCRLGKGISRIGNPSILWGTLGSPTMNPGGPFTESNTLCKLLRSTLVESMTGWKGSVD